MSNKIPFLPGIALSNPIVKLSYSYNKLFLAYYPYNPIIPYIWYTEVYQSNNSNVVAFSYSGSGTLLLTGTSSQIKQNSLLYDTFTDTNGTILTNHTMNIGPGWISYAIYENGSNNYFEIQSNKAVPHGSNIGLACASAGVGAWDGTITADIVFGDGNNGEMCVVFRLDRSNSTLTFWVLVCSYSTSAFALYYYNGSSFIQHGTISKAFALSTVYPLSIVLSDSLITCTSGTDIITYTDSTNSKATRHGIRTYSATFTIPPNVDNFKVVGTPAVVAKQSAYFTATDGGISASATSLPSGNAVRTSSIWFKLNDTSSLYQSLFCYGINAGGQRYNMWIDTLSGTKQMGLELAGNSELFAFTPDTNWHNFIAVYPGGGAQTGAVKFYLDGVLISARTNSSNITLNTDNINAQMTLGRLNQLGGYSLNARITDARMYNNDQSANVSAIYNGGIPNFADATTGSASLVMWFKLNEGYGNTCLDSGTGYKEGVFNVISSYPQWSTVFPP